MAAKEIEHWKLVASRYSFQDQWLKLRSDTVLLPDGQTLDPYHVIELPDWVNVIAITEAGNVVLVEQYRHVVKSTLIEIPAGYLETGEAPEAAARRELLEETGYAGGEWHALGSLFTVASRLTNQVHSYLALDVRKVAEPTPDASETLDLHEISWTEFARRLSSGDLRLKEAGQTSSLFLLSHFAGASADPRIARLKL